MATSRLQKGQRPLSSMTCTSSHVLALTLPIASLALLPRLLSLLSPFPIFLYANLLILAIFLSSSPTRFTSATSPGNSHNASDHCPLSEPSLHPSPKSLPLRKTALPLDSRSADLSARNSTAVLTRSHNLAARSPGAASRSLAPVPDREASELATVSPRAYAGLQEERQPVMKQPEQRRHTWTDSRIIRSKSNQRICDPAALPMKTLRRVETMDEASMLRNAQCDEKVSSSAAVEKLPIESLSHDDLNKKCAEFIAKGRAKMRREVLESTD